MELANIFLETGDGKLKLTFDNGKKCCRAAHSEVRAAAESFLHTLDNYIFVDDSVFYMAILNRDMFYFKADHGKLSSVTNEFFVFDNVFVLARDHDAKTVTGVAFVITDRFPIFVRARRRLTVHVYSNNTRFYAR